jgi:hypothetical protein
LLVKNRYGCEFHDELHKEDKNSSLVKNSLATNANKKRQTFLANEARWKAPDDPFRPGPPFGFDANKIVIKQHSIRMVVNNAEVE